MYSYDNSNKSDQIELKGSEGQEFNPDILPVGAEPEDTQKENENAGNNNEANESAAEGQERQWERAVNRVCKYKIQRGEGDLEKEDGEVELFTIIEESEMPEEKKRAFESFGYGDYYPKDLKLGLGLDETQAQRSLGVVKDIYLGGKNKIIEMINNPDGYGEVHEYLLDWLSDEKKNYERVNMPAEALEEHNEVSEKGILTDLEDYLFKHLSPEIIAGMPAAAIAFQFINLAMHSDGFTQMISFALAVASGAASFLSYKNFKNRRNKK